jgi:hypothetical protein
MPKQILNSGVGGSSSTGGANGVPNASGSSSTGTGSTVTGASVGTGARTGTGTGSTISDSLNNDWQKIQQKIKSSMLNSKNEIAIAQRHAQANMDNYLKALGIEGTGLGQSAYIDLATQYSNMLSDVNTEERDRLDDAETDYNSKISADVKNLIDNNADDETINQYLQYLQEQGENTSTLEAYKTAVYNDRMSALEKETHSKVNELLATNPTNRTYVDSIIREAKKQGISTIFLETLVDAHFNGVQLSKAEEASQKLLSDMSVLMSANGTVEDVNALIAKAAKEGIDTSLAKSIATAYASGKVDEATNKAFEEMLTLMEMDATQERINEYISGCDPNINTSFMQETADAYFENKAKVEKEEASKEVFNEAIDLISGGIFDDESLKPYREQLAGTKYESSLDTYVKLGKKTLNDQEKTEVLSLLESMISSGAYEPEFIWKTLDLAESKGVDTAILDSVGGARDYDVDNLLGNLKDAIEYSIKNFDDKEKYSGTLSKSDLQNLLNKVNDALSKEDVKIRRKAYLEIRESYSTNNIDSSGIQESLGAPKEVVDAVEAFNGDHYKAISLDDIVAYTGGKPFNVSHQDALGDTIDGSAWGWGKGGGGNPLYWGRDDDFSVDFNGDKRHIDVDWKGGGGNGLPKVDFNYAKYNIEKIFGEKIDENKDTFVIYNNKLWFYSSQEKTWGIVHNTGDGEKIYEDMVKAAKNGKW